MNKDNIIKNLEMRERKLYKTIFQDKLRSDAMESKIGEYMEMENEFEEMKGKYHIKDEDNKVCFRCNERYTDKKYIENGVCVEKCTEYFVTNYTNFSCRDC